MRRISGTSAKWLLYPATHLLARLPDFPDQNLLLPRLVKRLVVPAHPSVVPVLPQLRDERIARRVEEIDGDLLRILSLDSRNEVVERDIEKRASVFRERGRRGQSYGRRVPEVDEVALYEINEARYRVLVNACMCANIAGQRDTNKVQGR